MESKPGKKERVPSSAIMRLPLKGIYHREQSNIINANTMENLCLENLRYHFRIGLQFKCISTSQWGNKRCKQKKEKYMVKNLSDFGILPQSFSRLKSREKVKKKLVKKTWNSPDTVAVGWTENKLLVVVEEYLG